MNSAGQLLVGIYFWAALAWMSFVALILGGVTGSVWTCLLIVWGLFALYYVHLRQQAKEEAEAEEFDDEYDDEYEYEDEYEDY